MELYFSIFISCVAEGRDHRSGGRGASDQSLWNVLLFFFNYLFRLPLCLWINARDLPVAAEHIEHNDDEPQAVAGQEGVTEEPGQPAGAMLPPGHLIDNNGRDERHSWVGVSLGIWSHRYVKIYIILYIYNKELGIKMKKQTSYILHNKQLMQIKCIDFE